MSTTIPKHMGKCPVHGGLPAPLVISTQRGSHDIVAHQQHGCTHKVVWVPEGDEPDFGKYDDEKLRVCIEQGSCHVCGEMNLPRMAICIPHKRHPLDCQLIQIGGIMRPMVVQPWVCTPCLKFAVSHCPPLRKALAEVRGIVCFVDKYRLVSTHWKPVNPTDPIPPEGSRVLSLIKIAMLDFTWMPLGEWARRWAPESLK